MRTARSARMFSILGASLIAIALPGLASADQSDSNVRTAPGGSTLGISSGSTSGISSGSLLGISSGSTQGISSGS